MATSAVGGVTQLPFHCECGAELRLQGATSRSPWSSPHGAASSRRRSETSLTSTDLSTDLSTSSCYRLPFLSSCFCWQGFDAANLRLSIASTAEPFLDVK